MRTDEVREHDHDFRRRAVLRHPRVVRHWRAIRPASYRTVVGGHPVHKAQDRVTAQTIGENRIEHDAAVFREGSVTLTAAGGLRHYVGERITVTDSARHD